MASSDLIVDDDYIAEMGKYYSTMGKNIDDMIDGYISEIQNIKDLAIKEGSIAEKLSTYIECAQSLKAKAGDIGDELQSLMDAFVTDVDDADQFLF